MVSASASENDVLTSKQVHLVPRGHKDSVSEMPFLHKCMKEAAVPLVQHVYVHTRLW